MSEVGQRLKFRRVLKPERGVNIRCSSLIILLYSFFFFLEELVTYLYYAYMRGVFFCTS